MRLGAVVTPPHLRNTMSVGLHGTLLYYLLKLDANPSIESFVVFASSPKITPSTRSYINLLKPTGYVMHQRFNL